MGTRAVVHVDLRPFHIGKDVWIATHWDGYPKGLGKTLQKTIKSELSIIRKGKYFTEYLGSALQKAVGKAAAEHSIDYMTTDGKEEFDKIYGDWAEYLYEVTPKGELKIKELTGSWDEHKGESPSKWKVLKTYSFDKKTRSKRKLKQVV
jgi:hypothetical protein